ncbi:MAG: helix-turn-helix transcriptional regulator [Candidatus Krumholzibacteriia bacterium]
MKADRSTRTRDRILFLLKTRGPHTAVQLARRLEVTPMGARQHLAQLEEQGLVGFEEERRGVGRPARTWRLTERGHARYPEGYADLTLDILTAVRRTFGAEGLDRLIRGRTRQQLRHYRERLPKPGIALSKRVSTLAKLRSEEGYMAEWSRNRDASFSLIENHCPICAAAQICQGLCTGELELFQSVLGRDVSITRHEHILDGARRCTYRIRHRRGPRAAS